MAAIAGIAAVIAAQMACPAFRIVVTVQDEMGVVIEGCRSPLLLGMALAAISCDLLMERIGGRFVAGLAFFSGVALEQCVIEPAFCPEALHPGMIAVAGEAILLQQLLMKRGAGEWFLDRLPEGRQLANFVRLVTVCAALVCDTCKRRVAGKAVSFERAVAGNQSAWTDHQVRIDECEDSQHDQVDR